MERTVARLGCDCHFKKFPLVRVRLAYRERSDVMSISISAVISQDRFVECDIRSLRSRYSNWSCQTSVQSNRMQIMKLKQLVCAGIAVLIFGKSLDGEATLRHRSGDRIRTAGKSRLFTANTHKEFTRFNFLIAVVVCHCHLCRCNGELKHSFFAGL